ncbi:MAG TPA: PadR family transcriptional regulator [Candidatus Cybelea sp.]|nr:PadR family transcriptional regulator [Candidatus Cybelea sp.]
MDIKTLCLGLLTFGDASGYEIKKSFEGELRHFYEASFGSIYPALMRLTKDGLVTCTEQAQVNRPDKKVYRITPAGRMAFLDALQQKPPHDRARSDFMAILMFADLLPARHVSDLVDERLASGRKHLADMRRRTPRGGSPGRRFAHGYGVAMLEAAIAYIEENRHLVESEALLAPASGR